MPNRDKVVIVGAGPAGIAAAIQLRRYGVESSLIERGEVGGLLWNASLVENYPGFPDGIPGSELAALFREQLDRTGVRVIQKEVLELEYAGDVFVAKFGSDHEVSDIVVIASGTKPRSIPGMEIAREIKSRVFHETCSLREIRSKRIAIIGAGDAAFDYAMGFLDGNRVIVLNRGRERKCLPALWKRFVESSGATYMDAVRVHRLAGRAEKVLVEYSTDVSKRPGEFEVDYVVIAVGRDPCLDFLGSRLTRDLGLLIEKRRVHMVGDVKNGSHRQVGISVGDGLRAAMRISDDLEGKEE